MYILYCNHSVTDVSAKVTSLDVDNSTIHLNGTTSSFTLNINWQDPWQFDNNLTVTKYTISCSENKMCPANQTVDSNTKRVNITNIISCQKYTFSVIATNTIGSGPLANISITGPCGRYLCYLIVSN